MVALPLVPWPAVPRPGSVGSLVIEAPRGPLFARSHFPLTIHGAGSKARLVLLGPGKLEAGAYIAPDHVEAPVIATILAATPDAGGAVTIPLAPWPDERDLFAVASYDGGIALHRARDGALLGVLALGGGVADVAVVGDSLAAPSTTDSVLWVVDLATGASHAVSDVPSGNEVATFDGDAYVTNRDIDGDGALTRVRDGAASRVRTGVTAEGLAIDARARLAYVANVNDSSVAAVDLSGMRVARRIAGPPRPFTLALDGELGRLDVVSNVPRTAAQPGGHVESIDLASGRVAARSDPFRFPIGVGLDAQHRRVFVTDEADASVAVLDARTLRPLRTPLRACAIPWRPTVDPTRGRLYVPCAGANAVAVFDLRTLAPVVGSPFATGGYPLAVAIVRRGAPEPKVRLRG